MSQATIFLIEEDNQTRPLLVINLRTDGYRVLLAMDAEDARDRVSGGRLKADLILVNLVGRKPEEVVTIGRHIRNHAELDRDTPLVVMAERYGPDLEGKDVNVQGNDWITYLEDHGQLARLIERLTSKVSLNA